MMHAASFRRRLPLSKNARVSRSRRRWRGEVKVFKRQKKRRGEDVDGRRRAPRRAAQKLDGSPRRNAPVRGAPAGPRAWRACAMLDGGHSYASVSELEAPHAVS